MGQEGIRGPGRQLSASAKGERAREAFHCVLGSSISVGADSSAGVCLRQAVRCQNGVEAEESDEKLREDGARVRSPRPALQEQPSPAAGAAEPGRRGQAGPALPAPQRRVSGENRA